eukprot:8684-Heterococcus_DN1.PRE.1
MLVHSVDAAIRSSSNRVVGVVSYYDLRDQLCSTLVLCTIAACIRCLHLTSGHKTKCTLLKTILLCNPTDAQHHQAVPLEDGTDAAADADADDSDDVMSRSDSPQPPWTVIPLTDMFSDANNPSNSTASTSSSKPSKKKSSKKKAGGEADANKDPSLPGATRPLALCTTAFLARAARGPQALQGAAETAGSVTVSDEQSSSSKSEPLAAALTRDVARDLTRVVQAASGAGGSTPAVSSLTAVVRFAVSCRAMLQACCASSVPVCDTVLVLLLQAVHAAAVQVYSVTSLMFQLVFIALLRRSAPYTAQ